MKGGPREGQGAGGVTPTTVHARSRSGGEPGLRCMRPILVRLPTYVREPATRGIAATLVVLTAILASYVGARHRGPDVPPPPATSTVVLTRTGGGISMNLALVAVQPSGTYVVAGESFHTTIGGLWGQRLRDLDQALDRLNLDRRTIPAPEDSGAEPLLYTLTYDGRDYPVGRDVPGPVRDAFLILAPLLDQPSLP